MIQVNGRVRDTMEISSETDESEINQLVLNSTKIKKHTDGKKVLKTIYIKGKLINIVVR